MRGYSENNTVTPSSENEGVNTGDFNNTKTTVTLTIQRVWRNYQHIHTPYHWVILHFPRIRTLMWDSLGNLNVVL